jgi:hypothetical protein
MALLLYKVKFPTAFFAIQAAVLESRRQRDEETEVGDIFEGNGESDSSIGSVSNSRFIIFKNLIENKALYSWSLSIS